MRFFPIKNKVCGHKKDIILTAGLIALIFISEVFIRFTQGETGSTIRIMVGQEEYGEYMLSENQVITIEQPSGYNKIVIADGTAYMAEADCPDKYCMDYKPISKSNETIVCLPHRIVVEVTGAADGQQPDAIAQ